MNIYKLQDISTPEGAKSKISEKLNPLRFLIYHLQVISPSFSSIISVP